MGGQSEFWAKIKEAVDLGGYASVAIKELPKGITDLSHLRELSRDHDLTCLKDVGARESKKFIYVIFRRMIEPDIANSTRAGGDALCAICNREYRRHPEYEGTFHVLCDGKTVKT